MTEIERWLPVVGYEGRYEVSDLGRVRSLDHYNVDTLGRQKLFRGKLLKPHFNEWYFTVNLHKDSRGRLHRIHSLVLAAFVGPRPEGAQHIRHLSGDQRDNRLENLAYGTASENQYDIVKHGNHHWANRTECVNGHSWSAPTMYRNKQGRRCCRACQRDQAIGRKKARAS